MSKYPEEPNNLKFLKLLSMVGIMITLIPGLIFLMSIVEDTVYDFWNVSLPYFVGGLGLTIGSGVVRNYIISKYAVCRNCESLVKKGLDCTKCEDVK